MSLGLSQGLGPSGLEFRVSVRVYSQLPKLAWVALVHKVLLQEFPDSKCPNKALKPESVLCLQLLGGLIRGLEVEVIGQHRSRPYGI